ncbi:glycoside hydrolase family 16 protein [Singulisphaera sp. PoT]|uniref:glycoside hydrolase family 16 protein n=1 Tax=Singulisphaera sp. PoT TaxID=3411797 RepID=UPI003BF5D379
MRPMLKLMVLSALLAHAEVADAAGTTPVMVQDFEKASALPAIWVVNIPNENAQVRLSAEAPFGGKQCVGLRYRFNAEGPFEYLGLTNKVNILAPVHKLRFALLGDGSGCTYGVRLLDAKGETHQYGTNTGQGGRIDFKGWKEVAFDLDAGHETWDGDKNGKIDYPITEVIFNIGQPTEGGKNLAAKGEIAIDSLVVDSESNEHETLGSRIAVGSPAYGDDVRGNVRIAVSAPGFKELTARSWKPGGKFGADSVVAAVELDDKGAGSFTFPADRYPHGPIAVRISGRSGSLNDTCYLQLYNKGGISWNEGIPEGPPPAARGMTLAFSDDFQGPLSISSTDPRATYYDHKPPNGAQDFSAHAFTGREAPGNPFFQVDSYLRIRASDRLRSAGLISSMKNDASGLKVSVPCYFEARFLGPNAVGAWPGFWVMTDYMSDYKLKGDKTPCDELDIIEAYGGDGPGSPNADDRYMISPHCWNQGDAGKAIEDRAYKGMNNPIRMRKFGVPSTWFESPHTYGCKVLEDVTIYYCDDVEVGRHDTLPICRERPLFFMVDLATGGGWPVDLSRYDGRADMYIDYIRVYKK